MREYHTKVVQKLTSECLSTNPELHLFRFGKLFSDYGICYRRWVKSVRESDLLKATGAAPRSKSEVHGGSMKSFLIGLGVGIGLGVLFAPMSGEETRTRLSETANDLADSARDTVEQGRDRMNRGVSAIRSATDRISSTVSNAASNVSSENRPTGTTGATL